MTTPDTGPNGATEPLLTRAGVVAFVTALLAALTAFGLPLTAGQQVAVLAVVATAAPIAAAVWARRHVFSPATVVRLLRR